ncbi:AAA family ATPase [Acinetobacter sp.]|uniref:AAA family ATPase n=1 Tax=Acinetobacter sp. TaxID=472 RepID=UPI0028B0E2C2|nr:AAA family ATPase [Acinetobacter sp.]
MTVSLSISRPLVDSFVHRKIKLEKTKGAGEAKFHVGSSDKSEEFNNFFDSFAEDNIYYFKKENLLEFLLKEKFEFCYQFINKYKEVSLEYWESVFEEVLTLPDEITFQLTAYDDGKRYYIRSESKDIFNDLVRRISLPYLSVLTIKKEEKNKFLFTLDVDFNQSRNSAEEDETLIIENGINKIIYGAPGAGKSAFVSRIVGTNYIRTVFHPETQYSDFIGCLKPHKDQSGSITYSFRKGPFIQILEKALLNPESHYFLVIEELNRANTAAVFGEIFQLLDRDDEGQSEYPIFIQDEDLYDALKSVPGLETQDFISKRQLIIPKNLSIIATMNSSDQAVFPLDTAFKRRWIFEYLPLDFTKCANGLIPINDTDIPVVEWRTLAQAINTVLVQLKVVEDKLIGPWFIKDSDLKEEVAGQTFIGKIGSYLWDDALKYKKKDDIFKSDIHGYGQLYETYSEKKPIFSEKFIETLEAQKDIKLDDLDKPETE